MSFRRHSTLNINEASYIKPRSSETARRKRPFLEQQPTQPKFQLNKRKKQLIQQGKFTEIERENRILLTKITGIMGKPRRQVMSAARHERRSLNSAYQKKVWEQIEVDNAKILQRIMRQKSQYNYGLDKAGNQPQRKIRLRKVVSEKDRQRETKAKSKNERPFMLQRLMNFNGTLMKIQILLTRLSLTIQGRTEKGALKVITIPRQQALDFIAAQCNSNIQNIYSKLTFNNGTLYLVGDGEFDDPQQSYQKQKFQNRAQSSKTTPILKNSNPHSHYNTQPPFPRPHPHLQPYSQPYLQHQHQQHQPYPQHQYQHHSSLAADCRGESREYGVQPSSQIPKLNIVDEIGFIELDGSYEVINEPSEQHQPS